MDTAELDSLKAYYAAMTRPQAMRERRFLDDQSRSWCKCADCTERREHVAAIDATHP